MPEKAWGEGCTQHDFMLKDECLVLNYNDEVIGSDNKYNVHKFIAGQPKGVVHRAFSVMLFDAEGRLLLQQRAASKVTFPKVWTNTCCSHPLHGQTPEEVDATPTSEKDEPMGVKHAAVRKLMHELTDEVWEQIRIELPRSLDKVLGEADEEEIKKPRGLGLTRDTWSP